MLLFWLALKFTTMRGSRNPLTFKQFTKILLSSCQIAIKCTNNFKLLIFGLCAEILKYHRFVDNNIKIDEHGNQHKWDLSMKVYLRKVYVWGIETQNHELLTNIVTVTHDTFLLYQYNTWSWSPSKFEWQMKALFCQF